MKLKIPLRPSKFPGEETVSPFSIRKLTSTSEIEFYLQKSRNYAVTAYAHLEPGFPDISKWLVIEDNQRFALCLIAKGLFPNYVFTLGDPALLDILMQSTRLPGRTFITCQPDHLQIVENHYELEWQLSMKRMVVTRETFQPKAEKATRLKPAQVKELNKLYDLEHSGNFSSIQIRRGVFFGIWHDNRLVAIAGTHLIARSYGIAYVGNVMTHPAYRNQGLATICASAVTAELLGLCTEVVLNVEAHNLPAVRSYTSLGYRDDCRIIEAVGHRKSFVGAIINNVCRKLGLIPTYRERMEPDG